MIPIQMETLRAVMRCSDELATTYVEPINLTLARYDISSSPRIAAFLAQIGHESGGLRYVREVWGPTPAQRRYEGRADLGNHQPGDGKRYMGRGLIQITGRANYADVGRALDIDAVGNPEALESPLYAALSAGWYWDTRRLNALADSGDVAAITRRINGGYNGLQDRMARYERAMEALT